jgi:hypothetical protein
VTPTVVGQKLVKLEQDKVDIWEYQSSLGALMYAMLGTHPELAHCVTILSQHSMMPGREHLTALKHVFRYLRQTSATKLMYKGTPTALTLVGYTDADWANDINDRHSISGHDFILGGAAISWSARKQWIIVQSTTEAKYVAGAQATNKAIWLRHLLAELGQPQHEPMILQIDNESAIKLTKNPVFHQATKHIEMCYHHMHYCLESGTITLVHVPTGEEVADILTKALPLESHKEFA